MKTWLISDTHFNHAKMVELCGRPVNFNDLIINNWKNLVAPEDTVIHLGDVILGHNSEIAGILADLPGKKILTLGNHDKEKPSWYEARGFDFVCKALILRDILFSHTPYKDLPEGVRWNIHGHFHNNDHRSWEYKVFPHNKLFVLEHHYSPIELDNFLALPPVV